MKKIAPVIASLAYLLSSTSVFAQNIKITNPLGSGFNDIGVAINNGIKFAFIIALIAVLVMLIWGAVEWILSGGSKEGLEGARKRIINALIGFTILALTFVIVTVAGRFLGVDLLQNFIIPTPSAPGGVLTAP